MSCGRHRHAIPVCHSHSIAPKSFSAVADDIVCAALTQHLPGCLLGASHTHEVDHGVDGFDGTT